MNTKLSEIIFLRLNKMLAKKKIMIKISNIKIFKLIELQRAYQNYKRIKKQSLYLYLYFTFSIAQKINV